MLGLAPWSSNTAFASQSGPVSTLGGDSRHMVREAHLANLAHRMLALPVGLASC